MPASDSDVSIVAQWTAKTVNFSYDLDGGTGVAADGSTTSDTNFTLATAPSKVGYDFTGWKINDTGDLLAAGSSAAMPASDSDVSIVAQWTLSGFDITFEEQGGLGVDDLIYNSSSNEITLPATSRSGYIFNGWYTSSIGGTRVG